ncbi:MAG: hypothetical protein MUC59_09770 [Saprospiraceae bacterium]|jgi:hypothetical protein|nr:hypothetical protein [Saprospiraceae bacterium]
MKSKLIIALLLLGLHPVWGQITPTQLLATAWDDPSVLALREQQAYLNGHDFELPLLRELQLRSSTRDWDPDQQEYAIRLQGNTPGMKRTQASIHATMKAMTEAERLELVQEAIIGRYELVLDAYFAKRNRQLLQRQLQVYKDKKAVFAEQLALGIEQDLDDFFRAEEDILDGERRLHGLSTEAGLQRSLAKIYTGKADSVAVDTLLQPTNLLVLVNGNLERLPPSVKKEQLQAEMAKLKLEMERKEGRNLLDFVQFGYTGNANDPLDNRFRIGAGIRLPWPNGAKLQIQERELEALQAEADATLEQQAAAEALLRKGAEFGKLMEEHIFLEQQIERFAKQYDPQRLLASGLTNPETLLRVQESLLRLEAEAIAKEKDMYQAYIAMMAETGALSQEPAVNWLSPNLELIAR